MSAQLQSTAPTESQAADAKFEATLAAEHGLARAIVIGIVVAIPICVALWVGLIALALRASSVGLMGPLGMATGVGILTGVFFGSWAGFVSKTHTFENLDRKANSPGPTLITEHEARPTSKPRPPAPSTVTRRPTGRPRRARRTTRSVMRADTS